MIVSKTCFSLGALGVSHWIIKRHTSLEAPGLALSIDALADRIGQLLREYLGKNHFGASEKG